MPDVKIPEKLYHDLIRFHIYEDEDPVLRARIVSALEKKVEAMARRQNYAETLSERQKRARNERV